MKDFKISGSGTAWFQPEMRVQVEASRSQVLYAQHVTGRHHDNDQPRRGEATARERRRAANKAARKQRRRQH